MPNVFLSYSSIDRDSADYVAHNLRWYGATVFIDYLRLQPGVGFPDQLRNEIDGCDYFLVLVSTNSANSAWVKAEVEWAHHKQKTILPIMLENIEMDAFWYIVNVHRIDFTRWRKDREVSRAIFAIARTLGLEEKLRNADAILETSVTAPSAVNSLSLSSDGQLLVAACSPWLNQEQSAVQIWATANTELTSTFSQGSVRCNCAVFSPIDDVIATGWDNGDLMFMKPPTLSQNNIVNFEGYSVHWLAYSPDGELLAVSLYSKAETRIALYSIAQQRVIAEPLNGGGRVVFSPDSKLLAYRYGVRDHIWGRYPNEVMIWNLEIQKQEKSIKCGRGAIRSICFSHDGSKLLTSNGSNPGIIRLWDTVNWRKIVDLHHFVEHVSDACLSPDARFVAYGAEFSNGVHLWDLTVNHQGKIEGGENGNVSRITFSKDGKLLIAGDRNGSIRIWNMNHQNNHTA